MSDYDKEQLMEVEMSAKAISCTQYIRGVNFKFENQDILIVDSPGLEDTRGPEIDIANMYGIVRAA